VLLPPELGEERRQEAVEHLQLVDQGMMGRTKGDQQPVAGDAGPAVMYMDLSLGVFFGETTDATGAPVAFEHLAAAAVKVKPVVPPGGVAGAA